jgi:rhamnogalacturonyl hydrolase YesR
MYNIIEHASISAYLKNGYFQFCNNLSSINTEDCWLSTLMMGKKFLAVTFSKKSWQIGVMKYRIFSLLGAYRL